MSAEAKPIGQFEYELTDDLANQAALALCQFYHLRTKKPQLWKGLFNLRLLLVIGLSLLLPAVSYIYRRGEISFRDRIVAHWVLLMPLALVAIFLLLLLFLTVALMALPPLVRQFVRRVSLWRARKLAHRHVRVTFHEDRFEGQTAARERVVPWIDLREVHVVPDFWLLMLKSERRIIYLPTKMLTAELQSLIRRKVTEAGVKFVEWALPPLQVEQN
jgi:hypothetical protein